MQLVLVTAMEDRSLVGAEGFASMLPLAATGARTSLRMQSFHKASMVHVVLLLLPCAVALAS